MNTSLDHLPPHKREQIKAIVALLQASAPVELIILFGSYARGDWVEDLPNAYFSDLDFMIIVATDAIANDSRLWAEISKQANLIGGRVPVDLLVHDIKQVNQEIRSGQYFFADVIREGILLHDSRRAMLARPKAQNDAERLAIGVQNFRYWFTSAGEFWRGSIYYAARGLHAHAAFLLHQAAERYFHTSLLVFTGYKPKTHDIEKLALQTAPLHPELEGALPRSEGEDDRLFKLLKRAYIEARYSKSYWVTGPDLAALRARVLDLGARSRRACAEKLASFCGAEAVGELPKEPTEADVGDLPEAPALDDPKAMEAWRDALVTLSYERGQKEGLREGREEGREEGLREGQARAIVDVLERRGVAMTEEEAARILACRDESTLAHWREQAWSTTSAAELLAGSS